MSDYSSTYNGASKDATNATIMASDIQTELDSISTSIATKPDEPTTPGTVEASKAVVVDSNKDATGFRKITGSTSTGNTAEFTYTGTTNNEQAILGNVTTATGATYAIAGGNDSSTGTGIFGLARHTTGTNYGVYGQTASNAGYAGYFTATVAGGVPIRGVSADVADVNHSLTLSKGACSINLNPRASVSAYNPIVQAGDQTFNSAGAGGAINTGVLTLAPYATDAVGIRIDSTDDTVVISGSTTAATLASTTATITTANITTGNITTIANCTTATITTDNITTANITTANITTANITTANAARLYGLTCAAGGTLIKRCVSNNTSPVTATAYLAVDTYHNAFSESAFSQVNIGTSLSTGTLRVQYTITGSGTTTNMRIAINGVSVFTDSNAGGAASTRTTDITVAPGDVIVLQSYSIVGGAGYMRNINVSASNYGVYLA